MSIVASELHVIPAVVRRHILKDCREDAALAEKGTRCSDNVVFYVMAFEAVS